MPNAEPSMLKPALIGGAVSGIAASLPGLNLINGCTCCSLVIAGGFLAAYLQSQQSKSVGAEFGPAGGAVVGLITGAVYGVVGAVVSTVVAQMMGYPIFRALIELIIEAAQDLPDFPAETEDQLYGMLESLENPVVGIFSLIMKVFWGILTGAVFCTLGGLIGGAVFKVEPPAPTPPSTSAPVTPSGYDAPPPPPSGSSGGSQPPPQAPGSGAGPR